MRNQFAFLVKPKQRLRRFCYEHCYCIRNYISACVTPIHQNMTEVSSKTCTARLRIDRSVTEYKFVSMFINLWIYQRWEHFGHLGDKYFYEK